MEPALSGPSSSLAASRCRSLMIRYFVPRVGRGSVLTFQPANAPFAFCSVKNKSHHRCAWRTAVPGIHERTSEIPNKGFSHACLSRSNSRARFGVLSNVDITTERELILLGDVSK